MRACLSDRASQRVREREGKLSKTRKETRRARESDQGTRREWRESGDRRGKAGWMGCYAMLQSKRKAEKDEQHIARETGSNIIIISVQN